MDWQLHWLEAEGDLSTWRDQIATEVAATYLKHPLIFHET